MLLAYGEQMTDCISPPFGDIPGEGVTILQQASRVTQLPRTGNHESERLRSRVWKEGRVPLQQKLKDGGSSLSRATQLRDGF